MPMHSDSSNNGDEDNTVDTSHADRRIWLVKLPDFLMERWSALQENDLDLGSVRIYEATATQPARVSLNLSKDPRVADLPKDYELNFIKHPKPNHVFSELNGSAIAVEGRIEHECHLRPSHITAEYRQLMKTRAKKSEQPRRTVQLIDPTMSGSNSGRQMMTMMAAAAASASSGGMGGISSGNGSGSGSGLGSESSMSSGLPLGLLAPVNEANLLKRSKRRHSPDHKRERLPRAALLDLLFSAFERYSHWNLKGLVEYTRQPTIYLRELLLEIAVYNKKGPYKSTYQLKPEYKNSSSAMMKMSIIEAVDKRKKEKQMNDDEGDGEGDDDDEPFNESEELENSQEDEDGEGEEEEVFMDA